MSFKKADLSPPERAEFSRAIDEFTIDLALKMAKWVEQNATRFRHPGLAINVACQAAIMAAVCTARTGETNGLNLYEESAMRTMLENAMSKQLVLSLVRPDGAIVSAKEGAH